MAPRYATVYPLVTTRALARPFPYELTDGAAKGAVVSVPLGRSRRRGVVVELVDEAPEGVEPVPIDSVLDELPPMLVDLALWVADYYGSTPGRSLELIAPVKRKRRKEQASPGERQALADTAEAPELTSEQVAALARIKASLDAGGGHFLLYGETGSGKTEVYLQACAAALERGNTAIVLVPEIALTPQTLGRFQARFGDAVALLHSGLTDAERRDERQRIAAGQAKVVVGARSAVFAPLRDVGVVCVDEEHDPSYKQESDPRYAARTVAANGAAPKPSRTATTPTPTCEEVAGAGADPARRGHGAEARSAGRRAAAFRRHRPGGPAGDTDGGKGSPLQRRRSRCGDRRRHRARRS